MGSSSSRTSTSREPFISLPASRHAATVSSSVSSSLAQMPDVVDVGHSEHSEERLEAFLRALKLSSSHGLCSERHTFGRAL